jgi:hypothetical protein
VYGFIDVYGFIAMYNNIKQSIYAYNIGIYAHNIGIRTCSTSSACLMGTITGWLDLSASRRCAEEKARVVYCSHILYSGKSASMQ